MPQFEYQVRTSAGKQLKGKLTASDKGSAMEELRKRGLLYFRWLNRNLLFCRWKFILVIRLRRLISLFIAASSLP